MKRATAALAAAVLCAIALPAAAQENWMVRVRALYLDPANKSDPIPSLGVPADAIEVSDKTFPEVDFSYFFSKNLAAELVLTYPQKHDVTVTQSVLGSVNIGTFKHLPPTLTLQYHFIPDGTIRPYVGAGINLTILSDVNLEIPTVGKLDLENYSVGGALQAGLDWKLDKNLYLNFDVKQVWIESDVLLGGAKVSKVKVDPLLWSVGLGWRF